MYVKSSPSQQEAVVEAWTADFLVFGHALYHWAILPSLYVTINSYVPTVSTYICTLHVTISSYVPAVSTYICTLYVTISITVPTASTYACTLYVIISITVPAVSTYTCTLYVTRSINVPTVSTYTCTLYVTYQVDGIRFCFILCTFIFLLWNNKKDSLQHTIYAVVTYNICNCHIQYMR